MIRYGKDNYDSLIKFISTKYPRITDTMTNNEKDMLNYLDGRAKSFIALNDSAYLDSSFSISSLIFANEIMTGESILSGEIEKGLVFKVNLALLCLHAARTLGSCNMDTDVEPFGCDIELDDQKYTDSHLIGSTGKRASQFLKESYIITPSYEEKAFKEEMNQKISSGEIPAQLFSELDEIFSESMLFPLDKSKNLHIEIVNASMSLSILCKAGLIECLPLLYYDLECAGILKRNKIQNFSSLEDFIFKKFWSGAYFSVVRGIRNLEYSSHEGSMVVGNLYSNLIKYESR